MRATYITFNEPVNGVYISQVINVVLHLRKIGITTKLIAIFSMRHFFQNRKVLLEYIPDAIALPSIGKLKHWKLNKLWLSQFNQRLSNQAVICRGVLATNLAIISLKNSKIIYDGRGAVWAEQEEYKVFEGTGVENKLFDIEKQAVLYSDKQIAISSQLISYWIKKYQYDKETFAIIPCTIDAIYNEENSKIPIIINNFFDHHKNDIIVVFSGGNGKWQQIDSICSISKQIIEKQSNIAFIFLTPQNSLIDELQTQYDNKVLQLLVAPHQVTPILNKCDFGIILRENNITNNVASPVKVAEYLAAGLKVIISPHIGDYSRLIEENELGIILNNAHPPELHKPSQEDRNSAKAFAYRNLTKSSINYISFLFS